jgi:hypothetical protein
MISASSQNSIPTFGFARQAAFSHFGKGYNCATATSVLALGRDNVIKFLSRGGPMSVELDEPKGWRQLQAMAQRATDPRSLAAIINEMNRILDQHERMGELAQQPASHCRICEPTVNLEVHT